MHLLGGVPVDSPETPMQPPFLQTEDAGRGGLAERVAALEREVEQLKEQFEGFRKQFE
jgi:uncharacterized protein YceH (UPF0502 family)